MSFYYKFFLIVCNGFVGFCPKGFDLVSSGLKPDELVLSKIVKSRFAGRSGSEPISVLDLKY